MKTKHIKIGIAVALLTLAPLSARADEIAPAAEGDFAGFEQLVQDSIDKSRGAERSAFGQAISAEARKLNDEIARKGGMGATASSNTNGNGHKYGHDKGENTVLKEQKSKLNGKNKKKNHP